MVRSVVRMEENQALDAAYAVVEKGPAGVLLVLKDRECGIFDCTAMNSDQFQYLLLKHYDTPSRAYEDFLKLVGKMCKKREDSKYFGAHLPEDNRMVRTAQGEHGITWEERSVYEERFAAFRRFVAGERSNILKALEI
ncbi:hypothetical protein D7X94_03765 [Acutalibacter sp. 1XD8-33]|uniref:hypothetical protein n=1 Tax=Acutalibacter sp. 1XD8-33 TaxID=2320081 RepID=UPI000EA3BC6F|nr:hypothetical protein [Acutalibacter sp. 1XD8-33]RKJ41417.1 hypothetical protein D7X94_03765 [Acutalibacter sp. 1XD8-33]